mmetsp:Transcript_5632/g.6641  ORF Transcript_5632/g.6641 Transcript_5632/m.6641 type:complete len:97 (+) Transcript_5632:353-643(+)
MTQGVNNEHQRFLLNPETKKIQEQNDKLQEAIQIGYQAEQDARDIELNLDGQSRQLQHAHDNVHRIGANLSAGSRVIDAMRKHEMFNKVVLCVVIL